MKELYRKYRPKKFEDIFGQDEAKRTLIKKLDSNTVPHAILFHGPYGTGKTSMARVLARALHCGKHDFMERNSADYRGIDDVRAIRSMINQAPMGGKCRVWLLDEIHKATNDAQNALLKPLEDPPDHVYFMLATTEPRKLIEGIQQRCLSLRLKPIGEKALIKIVNNVATQEKIKLSSNVLKKLIDFSGGSGREALQILDKIYQLDDEKEQLAAIEKTSVMTQSITIARLLMRKETKWKDVRPILKELENEDAEAIRRIILGYAKAVVLNKDSARAFRLIELFRDNVFDAGFAGIIASCYEILS